MAEFTDYLQKANTAVTDGIRQAQELNIGTIEVLRSLTSVLVPLSVAVFPNADDIVPVIDSAVDRGYDAVVKAVEAQYGFALSTLSRLNPAA